jgi:2',3'-cyclic-nucleotide 2'-phosphodiesterase (5'-nucleotidase family)
MTRRFCKSILAALTIIVVVASALCAAERDTALLTILQVNDFHGRVKPFIDTRPDPQQRIGGAAYLATMIKEARAKNPRGTLLLAAGDMFQGSPVSNLFHGMPVIEIMNLLKFDAMALGNHEFDWGIGTLTHLRKRARFPFLAANIVDRRGKRLNGIKPYVTLQREDVKIAVIGVTTPETIYITKPDNVKGMTFLSPETVLPSLIKEVKRQGASVIVLLSHLGLDADKRVAGAVPGIDVIVGGHSHTEIPKPLRLRTGTVITQAGAYGAYLGVLELIVDKSTGRSRGYTKASGLRLVSAGPQDSADNSVARVVKAYDDRIKGKFAAMVGETSVDLTVQSNGESNLGNLIADAMRAAMHGQIAFQNSGGIRARIPAGKITMEELYTVLPFDNMLVSMELTGKQVNEALEQGGTMEFGILQASGVDVTYDLKKAVGQRVVKARIAGETIDPDKKYTVITNDFLAAGGDNITALKEGKNVRYGDPLRETFAQYLKEHSPVAAKIEGRIIFEQ